MINQKKNILLLHSSNDIYGASKIFLQLIDLFLSKDFNIHVVLPEKGKLDDFLNQKDIKVSYNELGVLRKKYLNPLGLVNRFISNIKAIKFLSNYIKIHSINLVYTNTSTILCGGIAAKKNEIPSLFHIHEIPTGNKLYEFLSGRIINRISNKVLTVSNSVKKHWLKYIDDKKIERIYNGIIFSKTNSLIKLERDQDDFVITSVARLIPYKGHKYLIDIADELIKKSSKFKFLIVGDTLSSYAYYERSLKQKVKDLGFENNIKFLGFRNDVSSILKQSDLFIHPAISPDPLPTVLFESLHNDLPTVATNLGGAIEILDNGNNGLLIPYNDKKKAADLINDYCADTKLQKKHLENSKKNFKINFSSESFSKNILREVNSLLKMNNKIKISIIGTRGYPYVYSGYETFVKQLSERLVLEDCDVTIYCHKGLFKIRPKEIKGIKLVYIPTIETKILSQPIHSFLSIIHACFSNTDVVLVVNSANGPFGLLTKLFKVPTAINVDGLEWLRPKWKGLGSIYFKWASKMATLFYDQIINDSDEMRKIYLNLFKRDSKVIAYGANIRKSKNPELITNWDIIKREYYLVVGRLIPDNNADLIIKGFLNSNSKKKLVIVGDVPYKDYYASNLKKITDKRLVFTGYVKDQNLLAELYHNCYVYVHGHEFGGTNPTMIKAMAYGCAILALDTDFNKEMLQKGKFGIFFKKEPFSITNKIDYCEKENILMDKLRNESVNGITKKYDWDSVTKDYLEVFNYLFGQRN